MYKKIHQWSSGTVLPPTDFKHILKKLLTVNEGECSDGWFVIFMIYQPGQQTGSLELQSKNKNDIFYEENG